MDLKELLANRKVVLTDGAMGTYLVEKGELSPGRLPEELNLTNPDAVRRVHEEYLLAGSEIILTNTFGANSFKLSRAGLADKLREINEKALAAAQKARVGFPALIAGDLGPSGEMLEPLGNLSLGRLSAACREQVRILAENGADFFLLETFSSLEEARAILEAVQAESGLPVIVSFTFSAGRKGPRTLMGESPEQVASVLNGLAIAVGANCGEGVAEVIGAVAELKQHTSLPVWAKPNAGRPELRDGQTVFPQAPEEFAAQVPELLKAGARFLGGCCGTAPGHIKVLKKALTDLQF